MASSGVNYFGIRWFARVNNALVGWKLAVILLVIVAFLVTSFHGATSTRLRRLRARTASPIFTAIATAGIVFSYLGFRQGIEFAGETTTRGATCPSRSSARC